MPSRDRELALATILTEETAARLVPPAPDCETTAEVLARALRGRELSAFEERLVEVLHDDVFRRVENARPTEQCALSYARMRHLRRRMDLRASDLFADVDKMLALHDWTCLVDGTLTTLLTIHYNLCIGSIVQQGNGRPELASHLDELECMDTIGVFLATELGHGNNVQALETEASYDHATRTFVLDTPSREAAKFMPNTGAAGVPKLAVVMARLKIGGRTRGVFPFIVRIRTEHALCPGVSVTPLGDKPDYPLDNAITSFDRVRVPLSDWLSGVESFIDEDGVFHSTVLSAGRRFLASMDRVQAGKLCLSVAALSKLRASLWLTLDYAQQRRSFAPGRRSVSLLSYRPYQRTLFEGVATAAASAHLLETVAAGFRRRDEANHAVVNRLLAMGKVFVSSRALRYVGLCRERLGAQGMFSANRVINYWVGLNGIVTAEGDNEVLAIRTARELLVGSDYTPIPSEPAPAGGLRSSAYLVWLLRERERTHRQRVAQSMEVANASLGVFDAWNEHLSEQVELASIHSVRLATEAFAAGVARTRDAAARGVLERLLRLFVLAELAPHAAALIVDGVLSLDDAADLTPERERITASLHADVGLLLQALAVPNSLLDVPVVGDYVAAYDNRSDTGQDRQSYIRGVLSDAASEGESPRQRASDG